MSRWFRYYDDALNDPKVQALPGDLFKHWVNVMCIASKNGGALPSLADTAFGLRLTEPKTAVIVGALNKRGLLDHVDGGYFRPHNWDARQFKSDVSNDRVQRHRKRKRNGECNVTSGVTETAPDTEQSRTEQRGARDGARSRSFGRGEGNGKSAIIAAADNLINTIEGWGTTRSAEISSGEDTPFIRLLPKG